SARRTSVRAPARTWRSRPGWRASPAARCGPARRTATTRPPWPCGSWRTDASRPERILVRPSERRPDELRAVRFERGYQRHAEGSVLVEFGLPRVVCSASVEERVPPFLRGQGQGWVTAEYGMLPRA